MFFQGPTKRVITLLHPLHCSKDGGSGVEACDCNVFRWSETVDSRMLKNGILLEALRITAVEKANEIRDSDSAIS